MITIIYLYLLIFLQIYKVVSVNIASDINVKIIKGDYQNYLRNVWLGRMVKKLSYCLSNYIKLDLNKIDSRLEIKLEINCILRVVDIEFSLISKYSKRYSKL